MRRILMSMGAIVFVGALAWGATGAFFSDTETSSGNTFTAGAIDLTVDSEAHYAGLICTEIIPGTFQWQDDPANEAPTTRPDLVGQTCSGTWAMTDLGPTNTFFNLGDLKPGDPGENTISLHVANNDAYVCAVVSNLQDDDNGLTEPEGDAGDNTPGPVGGGELSSQINFFAWNDDGSIDGLQGSEQDPQEGDNIWQPGESPLFENFSGPASDVLGGVSYPLFTPANGPLSAASTTYVGLYWCYGTVTSSGPGNLSCDGSSVNNITQTDSMSADISFYVEQARNNASFECPSPEEIDEDTNTLVGAVLSAYVAPAGESCNVMVNDDGGNPALDTIQEGVDAAVAGNTVCVAPGTYTGTVNINKSITIAGTSTIGAAVVDGGFIVDADGVTVKGLKVTGGNTEGTFAGFYVKSGVDNLTIRDNDIDGPALNDVVTPGGSRGIVNVTGVPLSNILVQNNIIHEWTSGIYTNPDTGSGVTWTIRLNDITNNLAGIGELNSAVVTRNEFNNSVAAQEAIGAGPSYDLISLVNLNNFLGGTMLNTYTSITGDVQAQNNFWGPNGGAAQTGGTDEVDYTPEAGGAFAHN